MRNAGRQEREKTACFLLSSFILTKNPVSRAETGLTAFSIPRFRAHAQVDPHADVVLAEAEAGVKRRELLETIEDDLVTAQPAGFGDGVTDDRRGQALAAESLAD